MTDEDVVVAAMRCLDGVLGATSIAFVSTTGTPVDDDSRRREDEEVSPSCLDRDTVAGDKNGLLLLPRGVPSDGDARDVDDGFLGVDKGRDSVRDERSNKEEEEDADGDLCMVEEARKGFESAVASTAVDDVLGIVDDDDERDADPPPRVDEEAVAPLAATTALDSFRYSEYLAARLTKGYDEEERRGRLASSSVDCNAKAIQKARGEAVSRR